MTALSQGAPVDRGWPARPAALVSAVCAVALTAAVCLPEPTAVYWLAMVWCAWVITVAWALMLRRPSLAVFGLQVFLLLEVLIPATVAVREGRTLLGPYDLTSGTVAALQLALVAQITLLGGAVAARAWGGVGDPVRVWVTLPAVRLDRWTVALLVGSLAGLVLYAAAAGGDPRALVVLVGSAKYGEFLRAAEGPVVQYFKVLLAWAGVAMMVATLRLTSAPARSRVFPLTAGCVAALLLVSGGARWWLGVPAVGAALVWWKTTRSDWGRRPRRIVVLGAVGLAVVAVVVGGLRDQAGDKSVDAQTFVDKQLRGGIFATTAALVDTVPQRFEHLDGQSYVEIVTMPVPRVLWPAKPESAIQGVQRELFPREIGASFGFYGEAYANFGWTGVAVLCFGFACVLERLWLRLMSARDPAAVLVYAAAVPIMLQLFTRGYLAGLIAGMFGFVLGVALVARRLRRLQPVRAA